MSNGAAPRQFNMAYTTSTRVFVSSVGDWPNLVRAVGYDKRMCTKMAIFEILGGMQS
jgi:hypothetical protein